MTSSVRITQRAAVALALVLCARAAAAQTPAGDPQRPAVEFLPRTAFHMSAEHLSGDDVMFVWDTNFGGEIDVIDYRTGRAMFVANYQAILGDEFRHFDPNQGNYILSGSASLRTMRVELSGVFYHQSRHLADRANSVPVAWNMMGGRVQRAFTTGRARVDARADVRGVVQKSFVDYTWEIDGNVRTDVQIRPGVGGCWPVAICASSAWTARRIGAIKRDFVVEGGLRVEGGAGAMEFFLAVERRVDPYPLAVRDRQLGDRRLSSAKPLTSGIIIPWASRVPCYRSASRPLPPPS